ncbi:MAG: anthranilate phosphoribosyltransferase [Thermogutta sp.]
MLEDAVAKVERGANLTAAECEEAVETIIRGQSSEEVVARFLIGLHVKGETAAEIAGAARAMRRHMLTVETTHPCVLDIVGTGGDGSGTFNISTAAAIVIAAAGVPVAKHGNRRITSRTGSADVLAELGVNIDAPLPVVTACLEELGICFCFAPLLHPAMKNVAEVRRKLGHPTIFNLLGPLTNPAAVQYQVLGVGREFLRPLLAEALSLLGTTRSAVVHGTGGLDEVSLLGETYATIIGDICEEVVWKPEDFGLGIISPEALRVSGPSESAARIREVLDGTPGPITDTVLANSAAGLWLIGRASSLGEGVALAREAILSGAARELLTKWAERSHQAT